MDNEQRRDEIALPLEDVRQLCECNRELVEHLKAIDKSATGSIYGREYADKAWARIAAKLPTNYDPLSRTLRLPDGATVSDRDLATNRSPITDAAARRIGMLAARFASGRITAQTFGESANAVLDELRAIELAFAACARTNYRRGYEHGRDAKRIDPATLLAWYDAGAGSGSHLAETLGIAVSREVRALANVLQCAKESAEVQRMLAELAT